MKLHLIAPSLLMAAAASLSHAETFSIRAGEQFAAVRAKLYATGWRADPEAHAGVGDYFGVDRRLIERGFDEVDYCSLGKTFCVFQYRRAGACLRLQTEGEQIAAMRVVSWSRECREQAADEPPVVLPAEVRFLLQRRGDCKQFGDCDSVDAYSRKVARKYARHPAAMLALKNNARQAVGPSR